MSIWTDLHLPWAPPQVGCETKMTASALLLGVVKNGMNGDRFIARQALAAGEATPESLLAQLRATVGTHRAPPMAKPIVALEDTVCHSAAFAVLLTSKGSFPKTPWSRWLKT